MKKKARPLLREENDEYLWDILPSLFNCMMIYFLFYKEMHLICVSSAIFSEEEEKNFNLLCFKNCKSFLTMKWSVLEKTFTNHKENLTKFLQSVLNTQKSFWLVYETFYDLPLSIIIREAPHILIPQDLKYLTFYNATFFCKL